MRYIIGVRKRGEEKKLPYREGREMELLKEVRRVTEEELVEKWKATVYWMRFYRRQYLCYKLAAENTNNPLVQGHARRQMKVVAELYAMEVRQAQLILAQLKALREGLKEASCGAG